MLTARKLPWQPHVQTALILCILSILAASCTWWEKKKTPIAGSFKAVAWHKNLDADAVITEMQAFPQFFFFSEKMGETTYHASFWLPEELVNGEKLKELSAVLLFSGRGESVRPYKRSALGWLYDYRLPYALELAKAGTLEQGPWQPDFQDKEALRLYAGLFKTYPLKPILFIAPTMIEKDPSAQNEQYETFITKVIPELIKKRFQVDKVKLGVDGVSFGGNWALHFLSRYPELFASAGALEPAINNPGLTAALLKKAPALPPFYLASANRDPLLPGIRAFSESPEAIRDLPHAFYYFNGDHSYEFNQTVGSLHMIFWHNLKLNHQAPSDPLLSLTKAQRAL